MITMFDKYDYVKVLSSLMRFSHEMFKNCNSEYDYTEDCKRILNSETFDEFKRNFKDLDVIYSNKLIAENALNIINQLSKQVDLLSLYITDEYKYNDNHVVEAETRCKFRTVFKKVYSYLEKLDQYYKSLYGITRNDTVYSILMRETQTHYQNICDTTDSINM